MAIPGPGGPPEPSHNNRHYRTNRRSRALTSMMDKLNFEATRPVSADPAVALADALGQLPKASATKPQIAAKMSVEALASEHGLTLGDQNELTIRRIKRGKSYSFIRANGTPIRHVGTIRRLNSMAVPPAYKNVRYSPDPNSHLQAVGLDAPRAPPRPTPPPRRTRPARPPPAPPPPPHPPASLPPRSS